jgi:hypothetical protein
MDCMGLGSNKPEVKCRCIGAANACTKIPEILFIFPNVALVVLFLKQELISNSQFENLKPFDCQSIPIPEQNVY